MLIESIKVHVNENKWAQKSSITPSVIFYHNSWICCVFNTNSWTGWLIRRRFDAGGDLTEPTLHHGQDEAGRRWQSHHGRVEGARQGGGSALLLGSLPHSLRHHHHHDAAAWYGPLRHGIGSTGQGTTEAWQQIHRVGTTEAQYRIHLGGQQK